MSIRDEDKVFLPEIAKNFLANGYHLCATRGTALYLRERGFPVEAINKVIEGRPHIVDKIKDGEIALVINTVSHRLQSVRDSHSIRRTALNRKIPLYTTIAAGLVISQGIGKMKDLEVYPIQTVAG